MVKGDHLEMVKRRKGVLSCRSLNIVLYYNLCMLIFFASHVLN